MPRLAPTVRIAPTVKPTLRGRRPPLELLNVLEESDPDLRRRVRELESSELFNRLVRAGVVSRRGLRGRIPRSAYEEYMDAQLIEFLREYGIARNSSWRHDFLRPDALANVNALARKYGAPAPKLVRFIRYLRSTSHGRASASVGGRSDVADYVAARSSLVDVSGAAAVAEQFVRRYGLTRVDFIADFLHGDADVASLAHKYGAGVDEVQRVLDEIGRVQIADAAAGPPRPAVETSADAESAQPQIVARVTPLSDGGVAIEFDESAGYGLHYRIDPAALAGADLGPEARQAEELLAELRWINQRRSLVCRMATLLADWQSPFFVQGDPLLLKPISQAEVARQLGEHESTVSRGIRNKYVSAPHGTYELQFLCQRKGDVIARLVRAYPDWSDRQIQQLLQRKYGCKISRRTVNHHRNKRARRQPG